MKRQPRSSPKPTVRAYRNTPIVDNKALQEIDDTRLQLLREDVVLSPVSAYAVSFVETLDDNIRQDVDTLLADYTPNPTTTSGFVYAFRPGNTKRRWIKIGYTQQMVRKRIAQWQTELGNGPRGAQLIFSYPCADAQFAETLIQRSLIVQWRPRLANVATANRLNEVYSIGNWQALQLFVQLICRLVNSLATSADGQQ